MFKKNYTLWRFVAITVMVFGALVGCQPSPAATPNPTAIPSIVPSAIPSASPFPQVIVTPVQPEIPSLFETLADYFQVGAALEPDQLNDGQHAYLLTRHFNGLTPENVMKPISIQPSEGNFEWMGADRLVQFAKTNNISVHGHTLVWHSQVPDWMFNDSQGKPLTATPENKTLVLKRLETHIQALVGRYKGEIAVWDVINEAIDPSYPDCMRRTKWFELTGSDYLATAFRAAREADPNARLIINDYGTTDPARRTCLYNLVRDLLAQAVPVDGVGHQMHVDIENPSAAAIEETILKFADLGVEQYVTELDMSIYTNDVSKYRKQPPEQILVQQGYRYKDIFEVFKRQAKHIKSVTFWGMADDHTWLTTFPIARINLPLLFDEKLQAKYAYWGIVDPSRLPVLVQKLNIAKNTPVIDGQAEVQWLAQSWVALPGEARFQTRWDEDHLYLFLQVETATPQTSVVDVFIDANNGKTSAYENDDQRYTFKGGQCAACQGVKFSITPNESGYALEAAFPLSPAVKSGKEVGFDIRVAAEGQPSVAWNDTTLSQDSDTSKYGMLILSNAAKLTTAAPGTPVIDGDEDAVWATAPEIATDVWVLGNSGATAKVRLLWDKGHLYAYAVVTDSLLSKASRNVWEQDSVEVFLDQNNAKSASYEPDDGQYRVNFDNEQSYNGAAASAETFKTATRVVPGGYVVELMVTLTSVEAQDGVLVGFDFQVNNDENGDGVRDSVAMWNDPTGQSYQNTSRIGVLLLTK